MAGRNRKIPDHITKIFDKYTASNVRVLGKKDAIAMLQEEFGLGAEEAAVMFQTFDKDGNNKLSLWEFQAFVVCVGTHSQEIVTKFKELDKDGSGKLDLEEARIGLGQLKTATDRLLSEEEVDFFLKTTAGDDGVVDLGEFSSLLYRLRLYKNEPPPSKK